MKSSDKQPAGIFDILEFLIVILSVLYTIRFIILLWARP